MGIHGRFFVPTGEVPDCYQFSTGIQSISTTSLSHRIIKDLLKTRKTMEQFVLAIKKL